MKFPHSLESNMLRNINSKEKEKVKKLSSKQKKRYKRTRAKNEIMSKIIMNAVLGGKMLQLQSKTKNIYEN